jgi:hypothetical protein
MLIKYIGPKPLPYRLQTPIPFLSRSALIGELEFNPTADVPNAEWASFLLQECGGAFEAMEVTTTKDEAREEARQLYLQEKVGQRFMGKGAKWKAFAFLKRHKCGETHGLKKVLAGRVVIGWELVPLALADVGLKSAPIPWNKPQEGPQEVSDGERSDDRIEVGVGDQSAD